MSEDSHLTALERVWPRLARPFDPVRVVEALLGLPNRQIRLLSGAVLATSAAAEALLSAMPITLRSLAIATTDRPMRCYGEVRGPILWGETISARRASAGDEGIFVCATTSKAFDTDENRVLVAALELVRDAGREVERSADSYDDAMLRRARHNAGLALRYLEHRTLASVARGRPDGRAMRRTRAGTRRNTYRPAIVMLERAVEPLGLDELDGLCDARTTAQLHLLADLVEGLESRGVRVPALRVAEGALEAKPLSYQHALARGDHGRLHGIVLGRVLVDVPDAVNDTDRARAAAQLARRSQGLESVVVLGPDDVTAALDRYEELRGR
jgi:hypothetical protein